MDIAVLPRFRTDADFAAGKAGDGMKYKVMIVEDQTMPRELFELRVQASERFELALSIDNAALADVYCLRFPVDLILMDVITRRRRKRAGRGGADQARLSADQNHHRDLHAGMFPT